MNLKTIYPYDVNDYLILGLDVKWLSYIKENPMFTIKISKNKLVLESELR
ncbi:MAG: hypothetical protein K5793_04210 [Nitrosarchaeum sp.]|nr:hypothetical protein [Nitrosarchaeum sp.]